uniref:Neuronal growth regulator 1 n=1 Tax=Cyanistes caeruleus TaxID=156563 RepID=A0A8C0U7Z1_CYACU
MGSKQSHMVGIQRRGSDAARELSREIILITILGKRCKSVIQAHWRETEPVEFSKRKNAVIRNHLKSLQLFYLVPVTAQAATVSPKIFRISSDIVVNEGSNVTLVCLATGKPEPSISWRHISPSAKPFESGQYLDIYGITRDQAGEYECSAENDVSVPDVKKVKVTVNFAPTIQELKSSGVMLGGNGLIRCEGAGVPAPLFEWYKGERKLINGQQGITIKNYSTRSLLTVTNVTEEHFGNYTCVAANKLGTTNASLPLNPPSTAQYGITGHAEVLFSCWSLVLTLSSLSSIFYLKNILLH